MKQTNRASRPKPKPHRLTPAEDAALARAEARIDQLNGMLSIRLQGIGRYLLNDQFFEGNKVEVVLDEINLAANIEKELREAREFYRGLRTECERPAPPPIKRRARKVL